MTRYHGRSFVARATNESESNILALERRGVITPLRDSSGRRLYTDGDIAAIKAYRAKRQRNGPASE